MNLGLGSRAHNAAVRVRRAQQKLSAFNPDRNGILSGTLTLFLGGCLIAAMIVFGYHWVTLANDDHGSLRKIEHIQSEYNSIAAYVGNFTTECNCTGVNITYPHEFADNNFTIYNAVVPSAILQYSADNITDFVTRTLSVRNESGTVALVSDIPTYPHVFLDNEFTVVHYADTNMKVMLNCSMVMPEHTVLLTVPDSSGIIACYSDIPVPTSVFLDDVFAVENALVTSKEVQLNVAMVGSGNNVTMYVQDSDGRIAYLSDIVYSNGTYSESVFYLFSSLDYSAIARFNVSAYVSSGNITRLQIRNGTGGTIAYVDQAEIYVDVVITSSRLFPSVAYEGVSTLTALGVTQVEIWLCGGGGGGGGSLDSTNSGGGGGSASGVEMFYSNNVGSLFSTLNCTIGAGGSGGTGSTTTPTDGSDGGTTSVVGIPIGDSSFLEVYGYGGGGGLSNGTGGAGGGSGSAAAGSTPGTAGSEGGLAGGDSATPGGFRYPWHAGSGGGEATVADGANWYGGGAGGTNGGGATGGGGGGGGLKGTGGDGGTNLNDNGANGGYCAGGGGAAFTDSTNSGGAGGDGWIMIRYWVI